MLTLLRAALSVEMFLSCEKEIQRHGDRLPHWEQEQGTQFVTFRLGDAMPLSRLRQWQEDRRIWLAGHPEPWPEKTEREYHKLFSSKLEDWLDEGMGSCLFRKVEARVILSGTLMRFHGNRVRHHAWVIMPNHVHVLFTPMVPVAKLVQAWKASSARLLGIGSVWQRNYRDTLIRDAKHFANAWRYVRNNPVKAGLRDEEYTLWEEGAESVAGER